MIRFETEAIETLDLRKFKIVLLLLYELILYELIYSFLTRRINVEIYIIFIQVIDLNFAMELTICPSKNS